MCKTQYITHFCSHVSTGCDHSSIKLSRHLVSTLTSHWWLLLVKSLCNVNPPFFPLLWTTYTLIVFDERVNFLASTPLICACAYHMLHNLHVGSHKTIMQSHRHSMQQHTHKAVRGHVEAKKLLSHQRQLEYSLNTRCQNPFCSFLDYSFKF